MKVVVTFFCLIFSISFGFAQTVTQGPVVGAVTSDAASMLFFTDMPCKGELQLSAKPDFSYILAFPFQTNETLVASLQLSGLMPAMVYYYKVIIAGEEQTPRGSFATFAASGDRSPFTFTLGSCTEQRHNDSIFLQMQAHQPAFFLHLGDWLYTHHFKEEKFYYTQSMEHQKELYRKRYEMPNLKKLLQTTPIDFVYDDEDGVYDDFSATSYTDLKMTGNKTDMQEVAFPDSLRRTLKEGWKAYFPGYPSADSGEVYHSFVYGNAEFFFLDTRSGRSPNSEVFQQKKNGKWKYKVPENHHLLDTAQLRWLQERLQVSTADWKFIVSGVTFNQSYKKVLDIVLRAQHKTLPNGMTGAYVAASLATMWFAFPETQTQLLNFCHDNKIKNVVVLSGDAHTAAIDDGENAGFPELMAGGLAQQNSKLAAIIKNNLRLNLWNRGGQGIGNDNFYDAFGKVTVHGKESVTLSAVDKYGTEICSYKLKDGFIPHTYKLKPRTKMQRARALKNLLRIALRN